MRRQPATWFISGFIIVAVMVTMVVPYMAYMSRATAQEGYVHHTGTPNSWSQGDAFGRALAMAMDQMHKDMMSPMPTGDADRDFLATMIPHHEGAVEMARLVLIHGKDPLVRRLAEEIIAGQQSEIEAMRARLRILNNGADPSPGGYPSLGSTRGVGQ
jgi:uncharacterized protein (DUF305 family)